KLADASEFVLQIERRHSTQSLNLRDPVLIEHAFHAVGELETNPHARLDGGPAQIRQFHSSSDSSYSPRATRAAISSWQVTQYFAHGTASSRLEEMGSSHSWQTP